MSGRCAFGAALAWLTLIGTACSSGSQRANETAPATVHGAPNPIAAALDFDQSVASGQRANYATCSATTGAMAVMHPDVTGSPTASVKRRGKAWIVTVRYPESGGAGSRYEVRHQSDGFCVSRQIVSF